MADELRHSIVDSILAWIRSGIAVGMTVIAGFFTYFAWYYKEVLIPSTAPVNVTTELIVKEAAQKAQLAKATRNCRQSSLLSRPRIRAHELSIYCQIAGSHPVLRFGPSQLVRTLGLNSLGTQICGLVRATRPEPFAS